MRLVLLLIISSFSWQATASCSDLLSLKSALARAAQVLLDPKVSPKVVAEFEYGKEIPYRLIQILQKQGRVIPSLTTLKVLRKFGVRSLVASKLPTSPNVSESHMVLFKNDIFSDSFFTRRLKRTGGFDRAQFEPWLEWRRDTQAYVVHEEGASSRILDLLRKKSLRFYRGVLPQELIFSRLIQDLYRNECEDIPSRLAELRSVLQNDSALGRFLNERTAVEFSNPELINELLRAFARDLEKSVYTRGSYFVTLDVEKAKMFSKGAVVTYEMDTAALRRWVRKNKVYVGFESGIEIGFTGPNAILDLFMSEIADEIYSPPNSIWTSSVHPIWK